MKFKLLLLLGLAASAIAQVPVPPNCDPPRVPCVIQVRVSDRVMVPIADHKVLPDISDLKGQKLDSLVVVTIVISKSGDVKLARGITGDPALFKRSEDAAMKWHFKPYLLDGTPVEVDTIIRFRYHKNKVDVFVPAQG